MVDRLKYIALLCIPTHFQMLWRCFKTIAQLLDSDWPAMDSTSRPKKMGLMSPDDICTISAGPAGYETNC